MYGNVLITGASNGLGAAFVEAYRTDGDVRIFAVDKDPVPFQGCNIAQFMVDLASEESVTAFGQEISGSHIELVIHCAGIRGLVTSVEREKPNDVPACETMDVMDVASLTRAFQVNATGTFLLLRALLPNLRKGAVTASEGYPKVIVMASRMGSIGNNELPNRDAGSAYAYRASKAAVNAIVRSFAVDVPDVTFLLVHPGRVETKLVRCVEKGAISAEESVQYILPLIDRWERKDSGMFVDRFGEIIQW